MNFKEENLDEIEALLAQSMKGHHLLYDNQKIAEILKTPTEDMDFFSVENIEKVQELFALLIHEGTFPEKQSFLDKLDSKSYEIVLRTYFHILESTLLTASEYKH